MPDIQTAMKQALTKTLVEWDDDGEVSPQTSPRTTINNSLSQPSQNIQGIPMTNTTGQPHRFGVTNNVSRETFNYVKDNPGSTRKEIIAALEHRNFMEKSTSSLLSQMVRQKMVHITNGLYYADIPEYVPIKTHKLVKSKGLVPAREPVKEKRKYTKKSEGIGALLQAKIDSIPAPSQDALDAAAYAMGGQARVDRAFLTKLVRTKSPESIVENMNVMQARELYDYLKRIFNA